MVWKKNSLIKYVLNVMSHKSLHYMQLQIKAFFFSFLNSSHLQSRGGEQILHNNLKKV